MLDAPTTPQECLVKIAPGLPNPRKVFIPPLRFAIVEKNVYRGSYPRPLNFPFLETLGLKTVLSLTPVPLTAPVQEWCTANGIKIVHLPPSKSKKKSIPVQHSDAKIAIEVGSRFRALNTWNLLMGHTHTQ